MKKSVKAHILFILLALLALWLFTSCKTRMVYVPVESIKTEYKDIYLRDSVHLYDSVYIREKGDTIRIEKYKYLYRDKIVRDSVFRTDSVQVPYPVEVEKEVNRLTSFQSFQIWCGRVLLIIIISWLGFKWFRKRLF